MPKFGFDQEALIGQFAEASTRQGEALRKSVQEATLKALQGRELTLKNISLFAREVLPHLRPLWEDEGWVNHWWPQGLRGATPAPVAHVTA